MVFAAGVGSALEYYDFALYNLAAALILGPLFFPPSDPIAGLIASFGTYFVGFAVRPFGGVLFGSLGDRFGRKFSLLATILLMGTASTLIGALPTYREAGYWAPVLLVALRMLQGLGAGAEQAGVAVLMTECAPRARRGYFASLPYAAIQLGTATACLIYFVIFLRVEDNPHSWLWRIPFLFSSVIIAVAVWMRLALKESPEFAGLAARKQIERRPLRTLLANSKKSVLLVIGLRIGEMGGSSMHQSLAIGYMVAVTGLKNYAGTLALLLAALTGAAIIPLTGLLSDRYGRVFLYRCFAVLQLIVAFPVWWMLSRGNQALSIAAVTLALIPSWGMFGTQAALLPELFGARHRYIGVATGREVSAVLVGGTAPLLGAWVIAWTTRHYGGGPHAAILSWIPLASYVVFLTLISIVTTFFIAEPGGRDLHSIDDAAQNTFSRS